MSEIVERAARAMFETYQECEQIGWDELGVKVQDEFRDQARAAIEAIRGPTREMVNAVYEIKPVLNCVKGHDLSDDEVPRIFNAMIDEALR